ncbi:MAG: hypothetical protein FRX48_06199 [Lasallia pustulata]|uniref:Proteinase inhibitor, propeptide n=1 Tax=Lasallia pustulata TaxID=136370 RepID=A0A1W5CTZ1_9LECA|nr:MAG: hypothetical protein FRX48_06199 [Lasallia pustulata]SLM34317.1 Proteinase inhibitor, propeptide [Lasallia pustulata]
MRFIITSVLLVFLAVVVSGLVLQKQVVVSYPKNTPDSIIAQAKDAIIAAGGMITHEYKLFKGFAAKASVKALETVNALSTEYNPTIEEDEVISIYGSQG